MIQVGELCVMKENDTWKLGHVLQFATCDSGKKFTKGYKDNYVAVSAKMLGFFVLGMKSLMVMMMYFSYPRKVYLITNHWNPTFVQFQKMV